MEALMGPMLGEVDVLIFRYLGDFFLGRNVSWKG